MPITNNRDFQTVNGLQIGGYITGYGGNTPTNGQLLIGDATNGRFSLGSIVASNGVALTIGAGTLSLTTNGSSANAASTLVLRDASGNFAANVITAALAGNAATASVATALQTARTINGVAFDGTQNISFTTDAVAEGTTNKYYTTARASAAAPVQSVFGRTGVVALTSLDVSTALSYVPVNPSVIGQASGIASLDSNGFVPLSQLSAAVTGSLNYQGTWNASTNTPTITSGQGTKGWLRKVSVAGTTTIDGISQWNVGDVIVFNGTTWDKIDGISSEVTSVFGRTGAIVMLMSDITAAIATQTKNTFFASPSTADGVTGFRAIVPADLPIATASALGVVSIGAGLGVNVAGKVTANLTTVAGRTGDVVLAVADVTGAAPLASPALTGTPTAPTASTGTATTQLATTAFVSATLTAAGITPGGGPLKVKLATIDTNQTTTSDVTADVIYAVSITGASTAKFLVQVVDASNNIQSEEVLVMTDGTNTWFTSYGILVSNGSLGDISAAVSGGKLNLMFTSLTNSTKTIKVAVISMTQ